jgi:AraC family ethanolamine operon transcriptional activator
LESPAELLVNGHRPRTGDLIVFRHTADIQATFPAGFRWMHFLVHDTASVGLNLVEGLISEGDHQVHVLRPHYRSALAIRRAAAAFLPLRPENPPAGLEPPFRTEAGDILADLIRGAVGSATPVENGDLGIGHQRRMVHRCSEFMRMRLKKPASLAELCRVAFASPRTLEYAFKAIYQASPMTYYRAQRFSAARRDLLHSDKKSTSVTDIAKRFGFWHFGRFSTDYRIRFMESPSETLALVIGAEYNVVREDARRAVSNK